MTAFMQIVKVIAAAVFGVTLPTFVARCAEVERAGVSWRVILENGDVERLEQGTAVVAVVTGPEPTTKAISAAVGIISAVNRVGGKKGVEITGVLGAVAICVTPKGKGPFADLKQASDETTKLLDHWGAVFRGDFKKADGWLAKHDPSAKVADKIKDVLRIGRSKESNDDPPGAPRQPKGDMFAVQTEPNDWTRFMLMSVDDKVTLLFHTGYLSAEQGGNQDAHANRFPVEGCEKWALIHNSDNTVSFKSDDGHYLRALDGGKKGVDVRGKGIGEWERFILEFNDKGQATLKTPRPEFSYFVTSIP